MNDKDAIRSQYHASLDMLQQAITECPDVLWDDGNHKNVFWRVAYHTLFFTHLYLQPCLLNFSPWARHRKDCESLDKTITAEPYSRGELLDYLAFCRAQLDEQMAIIELEAPSGFGWLPFDKLELQFYNIRHIQHHVGELCERLGAGGEVEIGWVARHH